MGILRNVHFSDVNQVHRMQQEKDIIITYNYVLFNNSATSILIKLINVLVKDGIYVYTYK